MEKRKISPLGDFIIILVIVFFVFLFLYQINQNNVTLIHKINQEHNLSESILVPENENSYVSQLSFVDEKKITEPITGYIEIAKEVAEIERQLYRASVVREECITRDLNLKINSIILKIDKLEKDFININTKKNKKLNIDSYLENLSTLKTKYTKYKFEVKDVRICR